MGGNRTLPHDTISTGLFMKVETKRSVSYSVENDISHLDIILLFKDCICKCYTNY